MSGEKFYTEISYSENTIAIVGIREVQTSVTFRAPSLPTDRLQRSDSEFRSPTNTYFLQEMRIRIALATLPWGNF